MSSTVAEYTVVMLPDSPIGEFDYGPFSGYAERAEAKPKRFDTQSNAWKEAQPAHWRVIVDGINGAWREVMLPLKRGRTLQKAIVTACEQFNGPEDIMPDRHGYFGSRLDLR